MYAMREAEIPFYLIHHSIHWQSTVNFQS